ncbi:Mu-like prophage major head subunit gpT family protein [Phenylobacterium sp.]|uniref:Mu-like prophage major head subunit gpT family protein n=1 Tax=Phenylobacterium sp. TaxID=1871053 RepID=UPI00391C22EF
MPNVISAGLLTGLFTGFKTLFQGGFAGVTPLYTRVATVVPSSTKTEDYGWLGKWPKIREWIGDRHVNELAASKYSITNRSFETTVEVDRDDIEDDRLGIYAPMFQELGHAVAVFPDELVFGLLAAGFTTKCYDGQYFFDTDHPVGEGVKSNMQAGASTPWFLLDTTRSLKPLIFQNRRAFGFDALDKSTDSNVFLRKKYIYGSDGRCDAGFGFWQMAFGSKADLTPENYELARAAMMSLTDDFGRPLGLKPNLLVVPASLEGKANRILKNQTKANGETNEWAGTAEPLVCQYLV